jgi:hypothetical protein
MGSRRARRKEGKYGQAGPPSGPASRVMGRGRDWLAWKCRKASCDSLKPWHAQEQCAMCDAGSEGLQDPCPGRGKIAARTRQGEELEGKKSLANSWRAPGVPLGGWEGYLASGPSRSAQPGLLSPQDWRMEAHAPFDHTKTASTCGSRQGAARGTASTSTA